MKFPSSYLRHQAFHGFHHHVALNLYRQFPEIFNPLKRKLLMASSRTELMLSMHPCIITQSTQLRNASCINDTDPTDNDCVPINALDATNCAHNLLGISKTIHAVAHSTFAPTIPQTQQNFGTIGHNKIWTQLNTSMVLISSFHPYLQQNLMMSADRKYQSHLSLHIQKKPVHHLNRWVQ